MSYQKQNFANGQVLTAEHLNKMEEGIAEARETAATQPDWNETDETSPAFIMNKPASLGGGHVHYRVCQNLLYKDSNLVNNIGEFEKDYYASPIMLQLDSDCKVPCLYYGPCGNSAMISHISLWGTSMTWTLLNYNLNVSNGTYGEIIQ